MFISDTTKCLYIQKTKRRPHLRVPYGTFTFQRMSFGFCNAPATFQQCMMSIFSDMVSDFLEVFMDNFSVFGSSFDSCLHKLEKVLKRCMETNLVLSWEKSHFVVQVGIMLGHVSDRSIEVDKAKVELNSKLPLSTYVHQIRSFLGHARFFRRFIKDFSKISRPLCNLLSKDTPFVFDESCLAIQHVCSFQVWGNISTHLITVCCKFGILDPLSLPLFLLKH